MNEKENLRAYYTNQKFEKIPFVLDAEDIVYPVSGFLERPAGGLAGTDWFGVKWEYSEQAQAQTPDCSVPPVLEDICDWREVVKFPDLDAWDWEAAAKIDHMDERDRENKLIDIVVCNGLWERMNQLMGFENALCALLEEPEEVGEFLDAVVEYKIKLLQKIKEYYNPDAITFHDDWGTQNAPFMSPETWCELIKPRHTKIVAAAHELGLIWIQHSCGKYDKLMVDIMETGIDVLQCMDINDIGAAIEATEGKMQFLPSVHSQKYFADDAAGLLTEEGVRAEVHEEFMRLGATGHYMPFLFPPSTWYEEIVQDEFEKCREELAKQNN